MSRYRPPSKPSTPYITRAGFENLRAELKHLWEVKRPEVTRKVAEAAAMGDRSENAEYIYGKRQLREIDSRVRYLSKRLESLEVIERAPDDDQRIYFGAYVQLENEDGKVLRCRIVGPDEIDAKRRWISIDAPLARALLGKTVGDEISLTEQVSEKPRVLDVHQQQRMFYYTVSTVSYSSESCDANDGNG